MSGAGPTSWMTRPLVSMTNGSPLKFALPLAPSDWVHLLDRAPFAKEGVAKLHLGERASGARKKRFAIGIEDLDSAFAAELEETILLKRHS